MKLVPAGGHHPRRGWTKGASGTSWIIGNPSGISEMRELERQEHDTNALARTVAELRDRLAARRAGRTIGLVPTMGAFHEGHLGLMRRARADCDVVVVSIFVNPTQFVPGEDFEAYPRDERRDLALASREGVDLVFAPSAEEVYPGGLGTTVEVGGLADVLCGSPSSRGPAHFRGVATVVTKLFNMCAPDIAYFGQKDYQQTLVIKQLVRDLDMPVRIEVCPTARDADGLALSSRNAYLPPAERQRALSLKRGLDAAAGAIAAGAAREEAIRAARDMLAAADVAPEYLELLRADDLRPPRWEPGEEVVMAVAATVGRARLIDNALLKLPARVSEPVPT
jgi:pantoate--beta-alanine ligase